VANIAGTMAVVSSKRVKARRAPSPAFCIPTSIARVFLLLSSKRYNTPAKYPNIRPDKFKIKTAIKTTKDTFKRLSLFAATTTAQIKAIKTVENAGKT
jgi:hypothetical protein